MKKQLLWVVALMVMLGMGQVSNAQAAKGSMKGSAMEEKGSMMEESGRMMEEKGSMMEEKGSMMEEKGSMMAEKVTNKVEVQAVMQAYIDAQLSEEGTLELDGRTLTFEGLHEGVKPLEGYLVTCADFKDVDTEEILDVDLAVVPGDEGLEVIKMWIHKVDGEALEFEEEDNGSMKGSMHDHEHEEDDDDDDMKAEMKGSAKGSGY